VRRALLASSREGDLVFDLLRLGDDGSGGQGVGTLLCGGRAGERVLRARSVAHRSCLARELLVRDLRAAVECYPGRVSPFATDTDGAPRASEGLTEGKPAGNASSAGVRILGVAREHRQDHPFGGCAGLRLKSTMCLVREALKGA
jgi:hypothetical protein